MRITRAVVPTLFTVLNMVCGFLAIVQTSDGRFAEACYFIMLAGVFDALDGVMARLTKSSSQFGVEIDSLSDVISFGAAPAFLVYKIHFHTYQEWGIILSAMLMVMGGIRLARFNVQLVGFDKEYFSGLPIPSSAFAVVTYILTFATGGVVIDGWKETGLIVLVVAMSLIMVSTIKYDTLPKFSKKEIIKHPVRSISVAAALLLILFTKGEAAFYLFAIYVLFGIVRHVAGGPKRQNHERSELEESPSYDL